MNPMQYESHVTEDRYSEKTKESIKRLYQFLEQRKIDGRFDLRVYLDGVPGQDEVIVISDLQGKTDRDEFVIELNGRQKLMRDVGKLLVSNGQRVLFVTYIGTATDELTYNITVRDPSDPNDSDDWYSQRIK